MEEKATDTSEAMVSGATCGDSSGTFGFPMEAELAAAAAVEAECQLGARPKE